MIHEERLFDESYYCKWIEKEKTSFLLVTAAEPEKKAVLKVMRPLQRGTEFIRAVGENLSYDIGAMGRYSVALALVFCEKTERIEKNGFMW